MHDASTAPTKSLLLIAYAFPPAGGVGVQRALKFVKYLPEFNWRVTVLTAENPSVPLRDEALCAEVPETTTLLRARTREPGYDAKRAFSGANTDRSPSFLRSARAQANRLLRSGVNLVIQPDLQVLWLPGALQAGRQHLANHQFDAVMVTAPPFSSFLAGVHLAQKARCPLVLDYRDEWAICNQYWENRQLNPVSQALQEQLEKGILRRAQLVLATTPSSTASVRELAASSGSSARAECIYNGFDPDDFHLDEGERTRKDYGNGTDRYRLVYAGTLWNLNRVEPLVEGVRLLCQRAPQLAQRLEIVIAGRKTTTEEEQLKRLDGLPCRLVNLPFVDHHEAIRLMYTADGLVLLNSDLPHANRIVSGKAFEYIGAERTIFLVSPRGDMWDLLAECPYAYPCPPSQPDVLAHKLHEDLERFEAGRPLPTQGWDPSQHSRKARAGQLDALLRETCERYVG